MEDLDTKRLRDSLVEYEGYLREMRQVTLKNVETLDVIQRYTDKSAAGMQKLAQQSLDGIRKVTEEGAAGLRRLTESGTDNVARTAQDGEERIRQAAEDGVNQIGELSHDSRTGISRAVQECIGHLEEMTRTGEENVRTVAQECLDSVQSYAAASMSQISASCEKNREAAELVEKIEAAILEHMDAMKELLKQSDDFTHKENVRVYRNVQAVVVDEVKKQTEAIEVQTNALTAQNEKLTARTEALAAQNEELTAQNALLQKQSKGLRPLMIVTLLAAVANIALLAARIAGLL